MGYDFELIAELPSRYSLWLSFFCCFDFSWNVQLKDFDFIHESKMTAIEDKSNFSKTNVVSLFFYNLVAFRPLNEYLIISSGLNVFFFHWHRSSNKTRLNNFSLQGHNTIFAWVCDQKWPIMLHKHFSEQVNLIRSWFRSCRCRRHLFCTVCSDSYKFFSSHGQMSSGNGGEWVFRSHCHIYEYACEYLTASICIL